MRYSSRLVLVSVFLVAAIAPPAVATRVRSLNLEQMTERATTIFSGRCTAVSTAHDDAVGGSVVLVRFEVERALKGDPGPTFTMKMLAAEMVPTTSFREDEEVVIFAYGASPLGLSSPVGFEQGKFSVIEDKRGRKLAVNGMGNKRLFDGFTPAARERLGAAVGDRPGVVVERDALIAMVEKLRHEPRPGVGIDRFPSRP